MKKALLLLLVSLTFSVYGQEVVVIMANRLDSIYPGRTSCDLGLSFFAKSKDGKPFSDLVLRTNESFEYISNKHGYNLNGYQFFERNDNGELESRSDLFFDFAPFKYHTVGGRLVERKVYGHAMASFENNTDRGILWRVTTGAYIHPWGFNGRKFSFNFSLGVLGSWAKWRVGDEKALAKESPERQLMAKFINDQYGGGNYRQFNDVKLSLSADLNWSPIQSLSVTLNAYINQGLCPKFSANIQKAYPSLSRLHPEFVTNLKVDFKVTKTLSIFLNLYSNQERGSLAIWGSDWQSITTLGLAWRIGK